MVNTHGFTTGTNDRIIDLTATINKMDNQYGLMNEMGMFESFPVASRSIVFDRKNRTHTTIGESNPDGGNVDYNNPDTFTTHTLPLLYFEMGDRVTVRDIQDKRQFGTADQMVALQDAVGDKMVRIRKSLDQSLELMKIEAIKGISLTPRGRVAANMFNEFGLVQQTFDFELGVDSTNVLDKIRQLQQRVSREARLVGEVSDIDVICSPEFFLKLTSHQSVQNAYEQYSSSQEPLRESLQMYRMWGMVGNFVHGGVRFIAYDARFTVPSGSTLPNVTNNIYIGFGDGTAAGTAVEGGYTMIRGGENVYRAYYGPQNTLGGANTPGAVMFAYQNRDEMDKYIEVRAEMSPLCINTVPEASFKIVG